MVESGFHVRPDLTAGLVVQQFFRGVCTGALCMIGDDIECERLRFS